MEHPDSPVQRISKLIRLLKFTKDKNKRNQIIEDIQHYQDLQYASIDNQPTLFD